MLIDKNLSPECNQIFTPINTDLYETLYPEINSIRIEIIEKGLEQCGL
jgi:ribosomal protein L14